MRKNQSLKPSILRWHADDIALPYDRAGTERNAFVSRANQKPPDVRFMEHLSTGTSSLFRDWLQIRGPHRLCATHRPPGGASASTRIRVCSSYAKTVNGTFHPRIYAAETCPLTLLAGRSSCAPFRLQFASVRAIVWARGGVTALSRPMTSCLRFIDTCHCL